jgi:hypothetical protein
VIPVYSYTRVLFTKRKAHTRPRVQRASGIPHALFWARDKCTTRAHRAAGSRSHVCIWGKDEGCVPRMLRSAPLFSAWCAADPGSILHSALPWVPALRSSVKNAAPRPGHERTVPQVSSISSPLFEN